MEIPVINIKVCLSCGSRTIMKVKSKKCYSCRKCGNLFPIPKIERVEDIRRDIPIPKHLKRHM